MRRIADLGPAMAKTTGARRRAATRTTRTSAQRLSPALVRIGQVRVNPLCETALPLAASVLHIDRADI